LSLKKENKKLKQMTSILSAKEISEKLFKKVEKKTKKLV